ncbi:hypothetical protein KSC_106850 [Ktedonobacter sp. SOSP1-52]|uniref:C39 family peptidase n=1 Tax=Ktedonobacter sp. SOSP1-52 TaxID=2778366 RepID=UPI0019169830|nr:C39 family peptidase [Ktedonobacter sp. SOSP1-52]GHO71793.1 hypothetical protein KSC_106850 [Ktedonobacter sp. SOSP1-52]
MSELKGFPFLSQLNIWNTTNDRPSENSKFNCVPTSIAAGIQYLTGKHLSPDAMKDEVYGEGWVDMGTAASAFVSIAERNGVKLYAHGGDCVTIAHEELAKGHPVVFTQVDDYAPGHPEWTHVAVWYKDGPGWLSAMDPFGGKEVRFDDATWRKRMRANEVWILARKDEGDEGDDMAIDINSPDVKKYFKESDHSHWACTNGQNIAFGILGYYKRTNGLLIYGLPLTSEIYPNPGTAFQVFERGIIVYDPKKQLDNPPGSGDCYPMHINQGLGFEVLTKSLSEKIAAQQTQIDALKHQLHPA